MMQKQLSLCDIDMTLTREQEMLTEAKDIAIRLRDIVGKSSRQTAIMEIRDSLVDFYRRGCKDALVNRQI